MNDYLDSIIHNEGEMMPSLENIEDSLQTDNTYDPVNNPSHYNRTNTQPKDVIRDWELNFNLGSAVKYISRAGYKDDIIQDLSKAKKFLEFEIDALISGEPASYNMKSVYSYDAGVVSCEWGLSNNLKHAIMIISKNGYRSNPINDLTDAHSYVVKEIDRLKSDIAFNDIKS